MEAITLAQLLEAVHGTLLGDFRDENVITAMGQDNEEAGQDTQKIHPDDVAAAGIQ